MREGSFLVSKGLTGEHQYDHVIERYLDTVRVLGGNVTSVEFPLPAVDEEKKILQQRFLQDGMVGPYIAVVPGARWNVKEWPVSYWGSLLSRVTASGMNVVLLGSPDDEKKGRDIATFVASPRLLDYTGKTTLCELMAAISMSVLYMSADTGPLHIANALKKELIALFGPTCPDRTGPYGGKESPYIHMMISPTSTATVEHPLVDDPECMKQITVDAVWHLYETVVERVKQ